MIEEAECHMARQDDDNDVEQHERPPAAVGVSFRHGGKVYYFAANGVRVQPGDHVLARTERGVDIGEVVTIRHDLERGENKEALKPLLRRATGDDLRREERLREREKEAAAICEKKIAEHGLPMKLIDADYTFDGQRLVFYFGAEGRVDFRALVRDLAQTFHCRIELRQVGVRDEARMFGGLGPCGRPLCCAQWLRTFDPVGIKVAKDQGMSLNPTKISGICDRLMCCLLYEQEVYEDLAARLPKRGEQVRGQGGTGTVKDIILLKESVLVEFTADDITRTIEVPAADLRRSRGYWRLLGKGKAPAPAGNAGGRESDRRHSDAPSAEPAPAAHDCGGCGACREPGAETEADTQPPRRSSRRRDAPRRERDGDPKPAKQQPAAATADEPKRDGDATAQKPRPHRWRKRRPRRDAGSEGGGTPDRTG